MDQRREPKYLRRLASQRESRKFLRFAQEFFQKVKFVLTTKLSVVGVVVTMVDGSHQKSPKEQGFIGFFKSFFKILFRIQKFDEDLVLQEFLMALFSKSILSKQIRTKLFFSRAE